MFYGLFRDAKNSKISFFKTYLFKYIVSIAAVLSVAMLSVKWFASEPSLNTPQAKIEFGEKYKYYQIQNNGYSELVKDKIEDYDLNFDFVQGVDRFVKRRFSNNHDLEYIKSTDEHIDVLLFYSPYQHVDDSEIKDIALLFQTLYRVNMDGKANVNEALLGQISDREMPYYHFVVGRHYYNQFAYQFKDSVEHHFLRSIEKSEAIEESVEWLCKQYYGYEEFGKLNDLVAETKGGESAPLNFQRIVYLRNGSFFKYWRAVLSINTGSFNIFGVFFASMITLIWLLYLLKLDVFEQEKWKYLVSVFGMSCLTLFLIYPYHDVLSEFLGFVPGSTPLGEFLYEFVSIGLGEEMVKIIPVLILLRFTKAINEPFDYILYSSLSGLGFAFIENFGYLSDSTLSFVNARMLYAAILHMFCTSIIGYALMLSKYHFKKQKKKWIAFLIGYMVAAFVHTFYDFWLLNFDGVYAQITTVVVVLMIHVWFVMKNNSLNLSTFYRPHIKVDNESVKYFLLLSILVVFMGSYMLNSFTQGPRYGWYVLGVSFSSYIFFMLYISVSFSRYNIIKGHLASFVPTLNLLIPRFNSPSVNTGDLVDFYNVKVNGVLKKPNKFTNLLPLSGVVKNEIVIEGKPGSFLVKVDKNLGYEKYHSNNVIIQSIEKRTRLNRNGKMLVRVLVAYNDVDLGSNNLLKADFRLVGNAVLLTK